MTLDTNNRITRALALKMYSGTLGEWVLASHCSLFGHSLCLQRVLQLQGITTKHKGGGVVLRWML